MGEGEGYHKIRHPHFQIGGEGGGEIWNSDNKCKSRFLGRGDLLCKSGKIQNTLFKKNRGGGGGVRQSRKFPDYTVFFY